jgi:hypothetical protein
MKSFVRFGFVWLMGIASIATADIGGGLGPLTPPTAVSADGSTIVRVDNAQGMVKIFTFDSQRNTYSLKSSFTSDVVAPASELLFVSNGGEYVVMVFPSTKDSIYAYRSGKVLKKWDVADFLNKAEIDACAETGSTLQWFESGAIAQGRFYFSGPSTTIKALQPSYTVMRGVELGMSFSFRLDLGKLAIERQPDADDSWDSEAAKAAVEKGVSHLEKRQLNGAIGSFTAAILLHPINAEAYYRRGIALKAKAEEDMARAKKLGYKP